MSADQPGQVDLPAAVDPGFAIYDALVDMAQPRRHGVEHLGLSPRELERQLERLATLGMIRLVGPDDLEVVPPEVALPLYRASLARLASSADASLDDLTARYRRVEERRDSASTFDVQVMADRTEFGWARRRIVAATRRRITIVAPRTDDNDAFLMSAGATLWGMERPSFERRVVFDRTVLDIPGSRDAMELLTIAGTQVRLIPRVALGATVVDGEVAVIDITNHDPSGHGSLIIRHQPLVSALSELVETTFAAAEVPPTTTETSRSRYGTREAQTLALLAAGASDSTIARQLGVSQRTIERHIRHIMDDLGAATRFQAGVQAERRQLL